MQKLVRITLHSAALSLPLDDARWATRILEREAATAPERVGSDLSNLAIGFAEGRSEIRDATFGEAFGPQWVGTLVQVALIEPIYRLAAIATLAQEAAGRYRLTVSGARLRWPPAQDCFGTLVRLGAGDTTGAVGAARRLHAFAERANLRRLVRTIGR